MIDKLPPYTKNFYFVSVVGFFIWMLFFDSNDLINQYRMMKKKRDLEGQQAYYEEKIKEVNFERDALLKDRDKLEKFAREKYLMKKENEDIFIIPSE